MAPTVYKFCFPQDHNLDNYVAYAAKNLEQLSFWQTKRIRFLQFQFNFLKQTKHDPKINQNDMTTASSAKKLYHQTYQLSSEQKHPKYFIFQTTNLHHFSPITFTSLLYIYTIGIFRNYDPVKQHYFLAPYIDPTKTLKLNDDSLLTNQVPY